MSQLEKCDRRSLRSQRALRQALASELAESGDLSRINVASLTERAGLTRRTFYSHYRDIPDFINQIEEGLLAAACTDGHFGLGAGHVLRLLRYLCRECRGRPDSALV